jgi:Ca2+:H+ antiporter
MFRKALFATLGLAPVTIALHYLADLNPTTEFVLAALALVPLAWLIGEATEHAAEHTGPGIGGFLNATFGNAPELIIALLAVNQGLTEVVRGSLTGSVVGNLLLVLGFSLLAGGRGEIDRWSTFMSLGALALTTALLLIPSVPSWDGDDPDSHDLAVLSVPISIVLLLVYLIATWYSLRRHRTMHLSSDGEVQAWSMRLSLGVLTIATVLTALVAEVLVGSLETFADQLGLSEFFVAAVIVAIVGNAAEHGGAVLVAYRGKIKLAAEIALASSAQVAVFLIPAVALLSWLIEPLALSFRPVELAALAASTALVAVVLANGRSSRAKGSVLLGAYVLVAIAFYAAGDRGA